MIGSIKGHIKNINESQLLINTNDIGFLVSTHKIDNYIEGQEIELYIYTHFSQDKGFELYGFKSLIEKDTFLLVISCSGIGPKMGLTVLSTLKPEDFITAISLGDIKTLSSVSGIGKKKAELMIMQLKDKISKLSTNLLKNKDNINNTNNLNNMKNINQLAQALESLNYTKSEIKLTLDHVKDKYKNDLDKFDFLLRKSLSFLAKKI